MRAASLHRALLVALALSGCNMLTGVGDLATNDRPAAVDAGGDSGGSGAGDSGGGEVDAALTPYPHKDAATNDDASVDPLDAGMRVETGPDAGVKRVFVTSTTTQANFGGLTGGDLFCSQRASAANLGGTWRAWLSTRTTDAITRITASGPWYVTIGVVAVTRAQLVNAPLTRRIDRDELGNQQSGLVWTGTDSNGTFLDDDCGDWTSNASAGHAATGDPKTSGDAWTAATPSGCSSQHRLYCFEQ